MKINLLKPHIVYTIIHFDNHSFIDVFMVAFGFLSQNFERWWGPINGTLSFYEYMLSVRDTQTLPTAIKFI